MSRGATASRAAPGAAPGASAAASRATTPDRRDRSARGRVRRWWVNRLPVSDTWTLTQGNTYILPTKAGLVFAFTLLLMLLASINYQLNLGYALTFLLAGAGLVSMHITHGTLRGLTLHLRPLQPVFAGDAARLDVVLTNPGRERHGVGLHFHDRDTHGHSFVWCDVPAQGQASAVLTIVPGRRGRHGVPLLVVETLFPFGLFRAWTMWRPAAQVLAWPRPEDPAPPLPRTRSPHGDQQAAPHSAAGAEFDGVRAWRRGDNLRQVLWKKVARSGELVSRDTAGTVAQELTLAWHDTRGADLEQRLSCLTAWVLQAEHDGHRWTLDLPGQAPQPASQGDAHRRAALDALALWA